MAVKLIIAQEAYQDIRDSYGWYEQQRIGLGEEYLTCVDACIEQIQRIPQSCQIVHK
jgi:toxin ParE1/3/4